MELIFIIGVDINHEDLKANILGGYDGTDNDSFQEPNAWDGHGTACAGLAGAISDNGLGISGIGAGCSILPIRIAYSPSKDGNWVTSNSWIARSIDWARENGADVISNSWGGGAPSSAIQQAFERTQTLGRNGKGCVVVVAAGNESQAVSFPGTIPGVLTVSASNEYDEFKTKTSRDGENWWGSNFGPEVGVAAPGVHNLTTDITGSAGYTSNNYTDFNGTSSATPIVAGAAGLVLSANKNLRGSEVQEILKSTADKVGPYPYQNNRNDQFGFGRLNVLEAVKKAMSLSDNPTPAPAGAYTMSHIMGELNIPIKDNQKSSVVLNVNDNKPITDVTVVIDIQHSFPKDLVIILTPPVANVPPITLHNKVNQLQKEYKLSALSAAQGIFGKSSNGSWRLDVEDTAKVDEGQISSFGLKFGYPK